MIQIGVLGAKGRMGKLILDLIATEFSSTARLAVQISRGNDLLALLNTDVVIDVSSTQSMTALAHLALESNQHLPAFVVGSTGWKQEEKKILEKLGKKAGVLISSNFSTGVFALSEILKDFS